MKKITLCLLMAFAALCAQAQFMRSEELEAYAKEKYGDSWVEAAANLGKEPTAGFGLASGGRHHEATPHYCSCLFRGKSGKCLLTRQEYRIAQRADY